MASQPGCELELADTSQWMLRDPITLFEAKLAEQGILPAKKAAAVHADVQAQVKAGIKFAEDSPFPEASSLLDDVYA